MKHSRPHHHVTCAIIERDNRVCAVRRGPLMAMAGKWEFPGGKIEPGESLEQCLERELVEELSLVVAIGAALAPSTFRYPSCTVTLYPFVCSAARGEPVLREHDALVWRHIDDLDDLEWAEADRPVIAVYRALRGG